VGASRDKEVRRSEPERKEEEELLLLLLLAAAESMLLMRGLGCAKAAAADT
jgi:hypothetical protein